MIATTKAKTRLVNERINRSRSSEIKAANRLISITRRPGIETSNGNSSIRDIEISDRMSDMIFQFLEGYLRQEVSKPQPG